MRIKDHYDVVIIGGGLAGLSLARHVLLDSEKEILLLDKSDVIPRQRQKVGESSVQVGGYYFSKVLDMEEHLLREHFMKYNLRFYWKSAARDNRNFEDYGQAYIRPFSNIPSYQIDRNKFEAELFRRNVEHPRFTFVAPMQDLEVTLRDAGAHTVAFTQAGDAFSVTAEWVVDTSGRSRYLSRRLEMQEPSEIDHGASFLWVEGLVNIEALTALSLKERRLKPDRAMTGHLPSWLATNHFMGEGFWFWVIPLQGKTSLGLVYDHRVIDAERVATARQLIDWICNEFPLFARDLPNRKILDHGAWKRYAYDCRQTIHPSRWALSGMSGRFTDPLYSPGSDFIAFHNTLIVDAILTTKASELATKCQLYEHVMRSIYESLLPTFSISYDALGDQEAFTLKYTWELSVYFAFFVFPFINDFSTDRLFVLSYLGKFSLLGGLNKQLQAFISAYYQWKKRTCAPQQEPRFNDFMAIGALRAAERSFYEVGVSLADGRRVLDEQLANLQELARYIIAYVSSVALGDSRVMVNRAFVEAIDLQAFHFDPDGMAERYAAYAGMEATYGWSFDPWVLELFRTIPQASGSVNAPADKGVHDDRLRTIA